MQVTIDSIAATSHIRMGNNNRVYRTISGVLYFIYIRSDDDVYWIKSTNNGISWTVPVSVFVGTVIKIATWFDGTTIHMAYTENIGHDVLYRALNTYTDTLGTETTIYNGISAVSGASSELSITKTVGGNLQCHGDIDGGTETFSAKSIDSGATWNSIANVNEVASTDYYIALPGNAADTNDSVILFWDNSANEITIKEYDDSLDSYTETSIATSMVENPVNNSAPQFNATIRDTDNYILFVAWSDRDLLNADLRCWEINGSGSITEKTNVVLNSVDDQQGCAIGVNTDNDNVIVLYQGKSDGSETVTASLNLYYKMSADGMVTWGNETLLSSYIGSLRWLSVTPLFSNNQFYAVQMTANPSTAFARVEGYFNPPSVNLLRGKL